MKIINILIILLLIGVVPFWKCPLKYNGIPDDATVEEEMGYFIMDCSFYPDKKDRKKCNEFAKYLKCNPYKHKKSRRK